MGKTILLAILAAALVAVCVALRSECATSDALRTRVRQLDDDLSSSRAEAREASDRVESLLAAVKESRTEMAQNWKSIDRGQSSEKVRSMLGTPMAVVCIGSRQVWDYPSGALVRFEDGAVYEWVLPTYLRN